MNDIDELDDIGRIERFQNLWEQRKQLLGRQLTQPEIDDLAAQCKVKTVQLPLPGSGAPKLKTPAFTKPRGGI